MKVVKTGFTLAITAAVIYLLCVVWQAIFPNWPIKQSTIGEQFPFIIWTNTAHLVLVTIKLFVFAGIIGSVYAWLSNHLGKEG